MFIINSLPLDFSETSSTETTFFNSLHAGIYTGELVSSRSFDSSIDCIYVLTDDTGTDFLVSCLASGDDIKTMLDSFYGHDTAFKCLKDLIGVPVTVEIKHNNSKLCIEPCHPLGGTARNTKSTKTNTFMEDKNNA